MVLRNGLVATVNSKNRTGTSVERVCRLLEREGDAESVGRIPDARIVMVTAPGAGIARVVLPRTRPDDPRKTLLIGPCRAVGRRALIVLVPAIGDPLVDAATHVEQP